MRFFVLILVCFFAVASNASQWISAADIAALKADSDHMAKSYRLKAACESEESDACYKAAHLDLRRWMVGTVDDLEKPLYAKEDVEFCAGIDDCQAKLLLKDCSAHGDGVRTLIDEAYSEVYCARVSGYEQKPGLESDAAGIAAADAEDAVKAASAAALAIGAKRVAKGGEMIALMQGLYAGKPLSAAQKESAFDQMQPAIVALRSGSMEVAKAKIEALTADEVVIFQADIDLVVAQIDAFLAAE